MIIYGGYSPKCLDYCNDIWKWTFTANGDNKWSIISYNNNYTNKSWQHGAFLSNDGNYMYTIAGHRYGEYSNDVKQFNLNTYEWKVMDKSNNSILPPSRIAHGYSPHYINSTHYPNADDNNMAYIHGGYHSDYVYRNETEFLRYLFKLEIDETNDMVYWENITYNGLYVYDDEILTELNRWYAIPFPRMDHLIIHIPNSSHLLLFGGYSMNVFYSDTWRFDLESQKWIQHNPPYFQNTSNSTNSTNSTDNKIASRSGHQWSYLPTTNSIVLFGGYGNENKGLSVTPHTWYFDDTWILNLNGCKGYEEGNECHKNESHGYCLSQFCICYPDYFGIGCEYNICPNSECTYDNYTLLPDCVLCNGRGTCDDGTCICDSGYTGDGCTELSCPNDCNNRGNCTELSIGDVQCVCDDGYTDVDCGLHSCRNNCTNRGTCDYSTGICNCDTPDEPGRQFSSPDCALTVLASIVTQKMTRLDMFVLLMFNVFIVLYC